jgi:hypothetical protein
MHNTNYKKSLSVTRFRIKYQPREKASILKLRRLGYSINQLSVFFGRSTSAIYSILKKSFDVFHDLRKLPTQTKQTAASFKRQTMQKWMSMWEGFILGSEDKPP